MKKRLFDLVLVLGTAPLWAPAIGLMALVAWVDDGRPLFFRQERAGRGLRVFRIWKLRTMTREPDPRQRRPTRFGAWLRDRGLDELPQVLNVLAGDLSLVGPRPLAVADAARLIAEHPPFAQRFNVAPGVTGLAQVSLARGAALTARLDLEYARRRTAVLDLAVLARTAWINVVGKARGKKPWQELLGAGDGPA